MENKEKAEKIKRIITYIAIIIVVTVVNAPFIFMLLTSFKSDPDITSAIPVWFVKPTFEHYKALFADPNFPFIKYITNSVIASVGSTLLAITVSLPAAYSFARFKTGGQNLSFTILSFRMAPPIVFAMPMYLLLRSYNLTDSVIGLLLAYLTFNIPMSVWILKSFIEEIPLELEEAALVDGCTRFGILSKIILPLIRPGLAATAILGLIFSWGEFLFALFLTFDRATTIPLGIAQFITAYSILWGNICAGTVIAVLPMLIFGTIMQKHLVRGLTLGAIK